MSSYSQQLQTLIQISNSFFFENLIFSQIQIRFRVFPLKELKITAHRNPA